MNTKTYTSEFSAQALAKVFAGNLAQWREAFCTLGGREALQQEASGDMQVESYKTCAGGKASCRAK